MVGQDSSVIICYCFNQLFGINGGSVSAFLSSNLNSGFFRNTVITPCGNYIVSGQHVLFAAYPSPGNSTECATLCYTDYVFTV